MATKTYSVPLPIVAPQRPAGTPPDAIPGEQPEVVQESVDVSTLLADAERTTNLGTPPSGAMYVSADEAIAQARAANQAAYPIQETTGTGILNFLQSTVLGNMILLAAAAGIIVALVLFLKGGDSSKPVPIPPAGLSPAQTNAAMAHLSQQVSSGDHLLSATGAPADQVTTIGNMETIIEGSRIAGGARQYARTHPSAQMSATDLVTTGFAGPTHYAGIHQLDMGRYLDSLAQTQTQGTITENSAALHGLQTQAPEQGSNR